MTDDSAILSVDFLVGFTIFILAFIWVATMVPGLFIGLQSYSIDYDAVAYRTGVILVEDPGAANPDAANPLPWELQSDKRDIVRFGLAVSRDTPRILNENKVNRFFCTTTFSYPGDYKSRAIFGDYPYRFNITLFENDRNLYRSVGDIIPQNFTYGFIRRDVKIRGYSNTTIGEAYLKAHKYNNTEALKNQKFTIIINNSYLLNDMPGNISNRNGDAVYRINPLQDRIMINLTNLDKTRRPDLQGTPITVKLSKVEILCTAFNSIPPQQPTTCTLAGGNFTYVTESEAAETPPVTIKDGNLSMVFSPGAFAGTPADESIFINMTFEVDPVQQYLNNTHRAANPFSYDYSPANVTQPELRDAVLEVAVW